MRITILILTVLFSVMCFGQDSAAEKSLVKTELKKDTLNAPTVSINEVMTYLTNINKKLSAARELNLIQEREYSEILKEFNKIVAILEKKRKEFK